jgi:hypothetical protein
LKGDSDYIRAVLFVGGPGEEKAEARSGKKQNFESVSRLLSRRIFRSGKFNSNYIYLMSILHRVKVKEIESGSK